MRNANQRPLESGNQKIKGQAFTLVEILVVVSILGLLAGLGIPAIGGAMRKAKSGACLSNLQQIGTAVLAYAAENNGSFPEAGFGNSPAWPTNLAAFMAVDAKKKKVSLSARDAKSRFRMPRPTRWQSLTESMEG